jgi:hypothetical protein
VGSRPQDRDAVGAFAAAGRPRDRDPFASHDPGIQIIDQVWPGDDPFKTDRYEILRQVKHELGLAARHYNFNASSDARSIFRYQMHTLPDEVSGPIGTSTLFAA